VRASQQSTLLLLQAQVVALLLPELQRFAGEQLQPMARSLLP
jgi:hypothetical protein